MKALVIAPQPFFSPRGTPLSVYYRTLITAELGVKVDLLTYGQGHDVDLPGVRIVRIPRFKILGNVKVGPSWLKLFLDAVLFAKMAGLLITRKYDVVHAHEEAVFFCLLFKPVFRFRLIYDMHSSLPQQLTAFRFTKSRLLIGLFEKLENASLRSADMVITICEDLYLYADKKVKDRRKHLLIENSLFDPIQLALPDDDRFDSNSNTVDLPDIPDSRRLVVYTGTLEAYQGIDLMLESFRKVINQSDDAFLLIAGGTEQQVKHYRDMANELGLSGHCLFTGSVSKTQAGAFVNMASVLLSTRTTGGNTPLKIYEQLASGIPLVATDIHSHTQVLDHDVAFLVEPDPDSLAAGIVRALEAVDESRQKTENARMLYKQKYSREIYTEKMKQVLSGAGL